jgi:hypothetical protein
MKRTPTTLLGALACVVAVSATAAAGIPDPALSTATAAAGTMWISPGGTGETFAGVGSTITVTVRDGNGTPINNFPAADIWVDGVVPAELNTCAGGIQASANTNASGVTTITSTIEGGGCVQGGLRVIINGSAVTGSPALNIRINSPDITADLAVNLADVGPFSAALNGAYTFCADYFDDGVVNLADVGIFSGALQGANACI